MHSNLKEPNKQFWSLEGNRRHIETMKGNGALMKWARQSEGARGGDPKQSDLKKEVFQENTGKETFLNDKTEVKARA